MAVHDYIKSGDFATEKHVPVIETVDTVKAGETFHVDVYKRQIMNMVLAK